MGVMPQMASGEKTLRRKRDGAHQLAVDIDRAAAHAAGDVGALGFAGQLRDDDVLVRAPHVLPNADDFDRNRLRLVALKTVQATPFMPGFSALSGNNSTLPAFGGMVMFGIASLCGSRVRRRRHANRRETERAQKRARRSMKIPSWKQEVTF